MVRCLRPVSYPPGGLTYAALFPDHPGGIILANTTGGHRDEPRVIEAFGRVGGPEAAGIIERIFAEVSSFDPWSLLGAVRCPVLVLAGEDDPVCPLPVVEELASQLPAGTTRLVRLPGARHTIFREPPGPRLPRRQDLCRPDQGKPPRQLSRAARPGNLDHSPRGRANCADPATR